MKFDFSHAIGGLVGLSLFLLAMLAGCAGFTEDPNTTQSGDENENRYAAAFDMANDYQTGSVKVDENKNKITIALGEEGASGESALTTYSYGFSGDTLLLSYIENDGVNTTKRTRILLGGTSQQLEGVWLLSACFYIDDMLFCEATFDTVYWKFDGEYIEIRIVQGDDEREGASSSLHSPSSSSVEGTSSSSEDPAASSAAEPPSSSSKVAPADSGAKANWEYLNPDIDYGTMVDERDGEVYKTVKIGKQVWMAENLNYVYKNGEMSWCSDESAGKCSEYGRLYTWAGAVAKSEAACGFGFECDLPDENIQGVCPNGWHLPSKAEFDELVEFAGGENSAGPKLKSSYIWAGTDDFGFSGLPSGVYDRGTYSGGGTETFFWSTTEEEETAAYSFNLGNSSMALRPVSVKYFALSVRCLKD